MPANLHVRNVDDAVIANMKRRAAENGRSAEAEHRAMLDKAFGERPSKSAWLARAARLRAETAGQTTLKSEDVIRAMRDEA